MDEITQLYEYIATNHVAKFLSIECDHRIIVITFHKELIVKINFDKYYKIYINDLLYYDVDIQDIVHTVNDMFSGEYVFCKIKSIRNYKIKIIPLTKYTDTNRIICAWTIEKTLK